MRASSFLFVLVVWAAPAAAQPVTHSEEGAPAFVRYFAPGAYALHGQNWSVVQDARGLIYAANTYGILEFDGRSWRAMAMPEDRAQMVRSLAVDGRGQVFVGGVREVGFLAPDTLGRLRYVSLRRRLPPSARDFTDVWSTTVRRDGVYFQSHRYLLRWDGRRFRVWTSATRFHNAFRIGDRYFVREDSVGLQEMRGDRLVPVPGGERFTAEPIFALLPHPGGLLAGTRSQGFFLLTAQGATPLPTEADGYLATYRPYRAVRLEHAPGGSDVYAIGTFGGGVVLLDATGRILHVYREDVGLTPGDKVLDLYEDAAGGLWLALENGLRRIDPLSPLTRFGHAQGLEGVIYDVIQVSGRLYAATSTGLFQFVPGTTRPEGATPRYARFERVPALQGQTWAIVDFAPQLLVASNDGVFAVEASGAQRVLEDKAFSLYRSPNRPGWIYVGLKDGLVVLERTPMGWREVHRFSGALGEVRSMEEDAEGRLWVALFGGGVTRLDPANPGAGSITFGPERGLPLGTVHATALGGGLIFMTRAGAYAWREDAAGEGRFVPAARFARLRTLAGNYTVAARKDGGFWVLSGHTVRGYRPATSGGWQEQTPPALSRLSSRVEMAYEAANGVVWLGTEDGLLRYDPRVRKPYDAPYRALVRRVEDRDHRVRFGGTFGAEAIAADQSPRERLALGFEENALRFTFAAPAFSGGPVEYQYLLEGFDRAWSPWSPETWAEYTNLPESGHYRFRVRARNAQGVVSEEATYAFGVAPPWYRTLWAYLAYAALLGIVVWGVSAWRLRFHRRTHERERMVNQRLGRMNARLAETNERLRQAGRLKDELLANTSHELRTPLTAILGFSSLLVEEGDPEQRQVGEAIHRSGRRLLDTVNALLDMARLQAGMVELHPQALDVAHVANDVAAMLRPLAEEKGLFLTVLPEGRALPATIDQYALERILINLISNAIKFTEAGGVTVLLDGTDHKAVVTVRDTGRGISPEFLPYLFEAFRQESSGYGRTHEGSGLGLAIVQRVVALLHGRVRVESALGEGTMFEVTLPRFAENGAGPSSTNGVDAHTAPAVLGGARVLLLDPSADGQAEVRRALSPGVALSSATTLDEALAHARDTAFDAVLIGEPLERPEDERRAAEALRALPGYGAVPLVLLHDRPTEGSPLPPGFDAHLHRPVRPDRLIETLAGLLEASLVE
ncbi:MAG TPA: ATP-binding protein [Rubricoccaceae bacterium]|nr:ATP-binding protein [Rubricoccaceae bacterium]